MNTQRSRKLASNLGPMLSVMVLVLSSLLASTACAGVEATFAYKLSDLSGPVSSMWSRIDVDPAFDEVYSLNIDDGLVQIFNGQAMQVHAFGDNYSLVSSSDLAVAENGEVYVLFGRRSNGQLVHFDYRGTLIGTVELQGLPDEFKPFSGRFIDYLDGEIYIADAYQLRVAVFSPDGHFKRGLDLRQPLMESVEDKLAEEDLRESSRMRLEKSLESLGQTSMGGFSVSIDGTLYFTLPTMFKAYRMTPSGNFDEFGTPGGAPGKFGVVAGIEADNEGNIYVADRLRCVVLIFDHKFNFLSEFGYRGPEPDNLVVPDDIVVDEQNGKLYVSQAANLGVSVFRLHSN